MGEILPGTDWPGLKVWGIVFAIRSDDMDGQAWPAWQVCRGGNLLMVILFSDCKTTKAQNARRVCGHLSFANCNSGIYI